MKNVFVEKQNSHDLRTKTNYRATNPKTVYNGTETITYQAAHVWSIVPEIIKQSLTIDDFKMKIKKWKPEGCACRLCKTYIPHIGFI